MCREVLYRFQPENLFGPLQGNEYSRYTRLSTMRTTIKKWYIYYRIGQEEAYGISYIIYGGKNTNK